MTDGVSLTVDTKYTIDTLDTALSDFQSLYSRGGHVALDQSDCINAFASDFVTNYKTVILVTNVTNATNTVLYAGMVPGGYLSEDSNSYGWMCHNEASWAVSQCQNCDYEGLGSYGPWTYNLGLEQSAADFVDPVGKYKVAVSVEKCLASIAPPHCGVCLSLSTCSHHEATLRANVIHLDLSEQFIHICGRRMQYGKADLLCIRI